MSDNVTSNRPGMSRLIISLTATVLVLSGAQPFLWKWVKSRSVALHELRIQAEQIEEVKKRTEEMQDNYDNQKVFVAQLDSVVPQSRNALQVVERLETATQGLGVSLQVSRIDEGVELKQGEVPTVSAEAAQPEDDIKVTARERSWIFPLFITITATGRPEALIEYIDAVEHVQELSHIQKFTIAPASGNAISGTQAEGDYQLSMTVVFYLQGKATDAVNR
jgi:hypothetical protein